MKMILRKTVLSIALCSALSSYADGVDNDKVEHQEVIGHTLALGFGTYGTLEQTIQFDDELFTPLTLSEALQQLSGIGSTESAGVIQTVSVRGLGGQRDVMLLDGIPIITDRNAGTGIHFIDPNLLSAAQVMSGPSSAVYGAGALGGVVNIYPRRLDNAIVGLDYDSNGANKTVWFGTGNGEQTLMYSHLSADDSDSADGQQRNDHVTRDSVLYVGEHDGDWGHIEWLAAPARIDDMGRVSISPNAVSAPREQHLPVRVAFNNDQWEAALSYYRAEIDRLIEYPATATVLTENSANNWMSHLHRSFVFGDSAVVLGAEWSWRNHVSTEQTRRDLVANTTTRTFSLPDADEKIASLFAAINWRGEQNNAHAGIRYSSMTQHAEQRASADDKALSLTLGDEYRLSDRWRLSAALSDGVRFASLSERYYDGYSPEGYATGSADLTAEKAKAIDIGVIYQSEWLSSEWHLYAEKIEDFIGRTNLDVNQHYSYQNLPEAEVNGFDWLLKAQLNTQWSLSASLQHIRGEGEDKDGNEVETLRESLPTDTLRLAAQYDSGNCRYALRWTLRDRFREEEEKKPANAPIEEELKAANWGEVSAQCRVQKQWRFSARLSNVTDREWMLNAGEDAGVSRGRSLGLSLSRLW